MDEEEQKMEASPWASRRKAFYMGIVVLVLFAISYGIFWNFWYEAPNCFDGLQNGDETGVDCGGSCALICSGDVIQPVVKWDPRLFEVMPGLWSVLVYVENPNTSLDATYVPYKFTIYGENNEILEKREKATILPKNKTVGIFEGSINIEGTSTPRRAVFELGDNIIWEKNKETEEKISIIHGSLLRLENTPRVEASVKSDVVEKIENIELVITIFDGADNAIAASRTFIEEIKKNEEKNVFFTWPQPFKLGTKACKRNSDVVLLLDRSGSMASMSYNPPQPLTSAKEAAVSFVDRLNPKDKVSIVSFATKSNDPIDSALTSDFSFAKQAIESIEIEPGSTQYTNIYEAFHSAWKELVSDRIQEKSSKIAILLTDGIATVPKRPGGGTEEENNKYAESLALEEAVKIKEEGLILYTIGLGDEVNKDFLKQTASATTTFFFAPTADDLETIYRNISEDICDEIPARIDITYKIFGDVI